MPQYPTKQSPTLSSASFRSDFRAGDARAAENRNETSTRRVDLSGTPSPRASEQDPVRKLVVGRDISLNAEISTCDHLIVEGTLEASMREGRRVEITETGLFKGTVEIEEADIAGRFEGNLLVRGRLRLRATGSIKGKLQYGELEVEAGGRIDGEAASLKGDKADIKIQTRSSTMTQPRAADAAALTAETA